MTDHTPGPWIAVESLVYTASSPNCMGWKQLADCRGVEGAYFDATHIDQRVRFANAHLIAAAPDLLEALEDAAHSIELLRAIAYPSSYQSGKWAPSLDTLHKAKAAIAKAKGDTNATTN